MNRMEACAKQLAFGDLYWFQDPKLDLSCIIAVHSTQRGPAIGGCRMIAYNDFEAAAMDAMRLAQAMSLKAAIHDLPHGGAKMVIMAKPNMIDRKILFQRVGQFVEKLHGTYITAVDSGTGDADMDVIATQTAHVLAPCFFQQPCTPALFTAQGVYRAILATTDHVFQGRELSSLTMALQGLGHVGQPLASLLHGAGVKLLVTDMDVKKGKQWANQHNATWVAPEEIAEQPCDVFVPCALGGVLNAQSIPHIQAAAVVGSANNLFEDIDTDPERAFQRGLVCIPDYVANGGGLIHAAHLFQNSPKAQTSDKISNIYDTVSQVLARSHQMNLPPITIADQWALSKIKGLS